MKPEDYQRVKKIFNEAILLTTDQQQIFLAEQCEESLRQPVLELLEAYRSNFLEQPVVGQFDVSLSDEETVPVETKLFENNNFQNNNRSAQTTQNPVSYEQDIESLGTILESTPMINDDEAIAPGENLGKLHQFRFALVLLVFALIGLTITSDLWQTVYYTNDIKSEWYFREENGHLKVDNVTWEFREITPPGDEIVGLNHEPVSNWQTLQLKLIRLQGGEPYSLQLKNKTGELRDVALTAKPVPFEKALRFCYLDPLVALILFISGVLLFLGRPNNKAALLASLLFALLAVATPSGIWFQIYDFYFFQFNLSILHKIIGTVSLAAGPLALHLFLIFPERSSLLRRFHNFESLLYLPSLLLLALIEVHDPSVFINAVKYLCISFYIISPPAALLYNYLKASKVDQRRIRILVIGVFFAFLPLVFALGWETLVSIGLVSNSYSCFGSECESVEAYHKLIDLIKMLIEEFALFLLPASFSYAILRHKVIPVSFVIRGWLQYLLAKNALRVTLICCLAGIVWNIAAAPTRPLDEILLRNTSEFYFFIAVAVVLTGLLQFGLSNWIDQRFIREQYHQELILREMIAAIKDFDSSATLSSTVSGQIEAALHPSSIHFFLKEEHEQNFTVSFTTSEANQISPMSADSALLPLMQTISGAIYFPGRETDDLPKQDKRWLRAVNADLLVPMHETNGKLTGFFVLGEKKSEIPYTARDRELLETLAQQIALVHENLNLKDHLRREQKIKTEVLARFDRENINLLKECPRCGRCFDRDAAACTFDREELTFSLPVERTIEDRYRLERLIGKGGMGAVYESTDLRLNRSVAVKILGGTSFGNRDALRRFEREAQTAAKLHHYNLVTVFDYGVLSTEGAFLVMELVRGTSLKQVLQNQGRLDQRTIQNWFGQILDGVEAAHGAGVMHRDLKPDNILVSTVDNRETRLCILDFGLAKLTEREREATGAAGAAVSSMTRPGTIMGTFGYMPPEQLRGEILTQAADLFAIGVMIYEAVNGQRPFAESKYQELLAAMSGDREFAGEQAGGAAWQQFFATALASNPQQRFNSAAQMKQALQAISHL